MKFNFLPGVTLFNVFFHLEIIECIKTSHIKSDISCETQKDFGKSIGYGHDNE